jgi:hypothetical protein
MILVLAGAGASRSVESVTYPTTVEFMSRLPKQLAEDELVQLLKHYAEAQTEITHGLSAYTDAEGLLAGLQELIEFGKMASDETGPVGWIMGSDKLKNMKRKNNFETANLPKFGMDLAESAKVIRDRINELVYELYSPLPKPADGLTAWVNLLKYLVQSDSCLQLFTTNYDMVIEEALERLSKSSSDLTIATGRIPGTYPTLDLTLWREGLSNHQLIDSRGLLTKLHGSVDWCLHNGEILAGNPAFKGDHEKHLALYFGWKGIPSKEPFSLFHDYFSAALQKARTLVVIGFSFRDEAICSTILKNISDECRIVVIDPKPITSVFKGSKKVTAIAKEFCPKNLDAIAVLGLHMSLQAAKSQKRVSKRTTI